MKRTLNPYGAIGFGLAAVMAVSQHWSLPEFCWSTWLAGLTYAWSCLTTAALQIILTARTDRPLYEERFSFLRKIPTALYLIGLVIVSLLTGVLAFYLYSYLFIFYGLFLSFFAEMEPHDYFGRNGFINSDFFSPVLYLVDRFWPMAVGVLIAHWKDLFHRDPWRRILLPFQREVIGMHLMILALPFFTLIAWALFGSAYQSVTIVLLMSLFYLLPKQADEDSRRKVKSTP